MIRKGAGPSRSAFLSAFFTLVGMHGAHVASGFVWLVYMSAQVTAKGMCPTVLRRLPCFSLFWHTLQIGVHLVFFLHLGSGPDDTNNILALAFGVLIVFLVIAGPIWIVARPNANLMSMPMN